MPDKSFDRQNKIDFEPNPSSHKIDRGIEEVEKREIENSESIKTVAPEIQNNSIIGGVGKSKKTSEEKDVVIEQVEKYCQEHNFSEEQEETLKKAISLIEQEGGDKYEQAENLVKMKKSALLDAFHDLCEDVDEIRTKITTFGSR